MDYTVMIYALGHISLSFSLSMSLLSLHSYHNFWNSYPTSKNKTRSLQDTNFLWLKDRQVSRVNQKRQLCEHSEGSAGSKFLETLLFLAAASSDILKPFLQLKHAFWYRITDLHLFVKMITQLSQTVGWVDIWSMSCSDQLFGNDQILWRN